MKPTAYVWLYKVWMKTVIGFNKKPESSHTYITFRLLKGNKQEVSVRYYIKLYAVAASPYF